MTSERSEALYVNSYNPYAELTVKTRIRQLLHTHQGRDKLFKIIQYSMRLLLWYRGVAFNPIFVTGAASATFSVAERNLMTITNGRRLFKIGRFISEAERLRVQLIKCSELKYHRSARAMALFLQSQMVLDILARMLASVKCFLDDIALLARKGFLESNIDYKISTIAVRLYLPVILIDLYLNTTRLVQGILDARDPNSARFSLLTAYSVIDQQRNAPLGPKPSSPLAVSSGPKFDSSIDRIEASCVQPFGGDPTATPSANVPEGDSSPNANVPNTSFVWTNLQKPAASLVPQRNRENKEVKHVQNYLQLFWVDFDLHWMMVTQFKLILDAFVIFSYVFRWEHNGAIAFCGLASGLVSVYRVWTYGR